MVKIDFHELALKVAKIANDKKAIDTNILDIQALSSMSNYFVVTTAESSVQINTICDEIEKEFKKHGIRPLRREGISSQTWRVVDFGGVIVHVMSPVTRSTYKIDELWNRKGAL